LALFEVAIRASVSSANSFNPGIVVSVEANTNPPSRSPTVTSTEAKNRLNALLGDVERSGASFTITTHGRPVAMLVPVQPVPRRFGQLPTLVVPADFDEPLPETELTAWEGLS
jgi:prevent-host-death family protein